MSLSRRSILKAGAGIAAGGALAAAAGWSARQPVTAGTAASPLLPSSAGHTGWSNWSGIQNCNPVAISTPAGEADIARLLSQASSPVRCVGAGHSFTALVPTDGVILSLDQLAGVVAHDGRQVRVKAGTRLAQLARELDALGLAMHNQPDIDAQSVAGAISTATHGTGLTLPALHARVQALRLVLPSGDILEIDQRQPDLLQAARVSLGSLGVISEVTLEAMPRYFLRRKVWLQPLEEMLQQAPQLAEQHRHFEFYYLPFTGYAAAITHDLSDSQTAEHSASADEAMLHDLRQLRDWCGRFPHLRRWLAQKLIDPAQTETAQDSSWRLLSTSRPSKFNETECHVPQEQGIACVREVIRVLEQRNEVYFPLEFRYVQQDDAFLSPFYQRASCSIAVHAAAGEAWDYLLSDIAPVFRRHGGRPHWGKLHGHGAADFAALYPRWKDFLAIREHCDPHGRMLNPHLRQIFGVSA